MTDRLDLRAMRPLGWSWQGEFHFFRRTPMAGPFTDLHAEVDNRMSYHPVTEETKPLFEQNRAEYLALAHAVIDRIPAGRHQAACLTALQESLMWANAAVACDS